jgi:hypothetical protein
MLHNILSGDLIGESKPHNTSEEGRTTHTHNTHTPRHDTTHTRHKTYSTRFISVRSPRSVMRFTQLCSSCCSCASRTACSLTRGTCRSSNLRRPRRNTTVSTAELHVRSACRHVPRRRAEGSGVNGGRCSDDDDGGDDDDEEEGEDKDEDEDEEEDMLVDGRDGA